MHRLPLPSTARTPSENSPECDDNVSAVLVARPPSAAEPDSVPPPATVLMIPSGDTLRTRRFPSAINRFPTQSTARLYGRNNVAFSAGPPSPEDCWSL